ncbi:MAG: hypothetical protein LPK85_10645, partial [Gammaproteobacteria bacterium]|nr:hypothetical protein [Gammaproteobacteria bacterium]
MHNLGSTSQYRLMLAISLAFFFHAVLAISVMRWWRMPDAPPFPTVQVELSQATPEATASVPTPAITELEPPMTAVRT